MLKKTLMLLIFSGICAFAFAQNESITFTTYYPSPHGAYRDLQTNTHLNKPQKRADIEARFHCTDGSGDPAACTGLMYFEEGSTYGSDTFSAGLYFFDGTEWKKIGETVKDEQGFDIGGYEKADVHNSEYRVNDYTATANKSMYVYLTNATLFDLSNTPPPGGKSANQLYGTPRSGRVLLYSSPISFPNNTLKVNYRNFPSGMYQFAWQGKIDIDQYINITKVERTSPASYIAVLNKTDNPLEYQEVTEIALSRIRNSPLYCRMFMGISYYDTTEYFYDNLPGPDSADCDGNNWTNGDCFSSYEIDRSPTRFYNRFSNSYDSFRYYRLVFYKQGTYPKKIKIFTIKQTEFPDGPVALPKKTTIYYKVTYDIPVKVRVRGVSLTVSRLSE